MISTALALAVIFGIVFLFLTFILKGWTAYHEFRSIKPDPPEPPASSSDPNFVLVTSLYNKFVDLTSDFAGRYVTKADLENVRKEMRKEINDLRDEQGNIKGHLGIK